MALDETISDEDVVQEVDGIKFVFAKHFAHMMESVSIDYPKTWFGRQLRIQSPFGGMC